MAIYSFVLCFICLSPSGYVRYEYYPFLFPAQFLSKIAFYWILIKEPITYRGLQRIKTLTIIFIIIKILEISIVLSISNSLTILTIYLGHVHIHIVQLFELIIHSIMIWGPKNGVGPSFYPYKQ